MCMCKRIFFIFICIFLSLSCSYYKRGDVASWYGIEYQGKKTSRGEDFDMMKYTAAHKMLPLGTIVKVTNLENGKSVVVVINDRGPFIRGRNIDLSYAAAQEIGMIEKGVQKVKIEVLKYPEEGSKKQEARSKK